MKVWIVTEYDEDGAATWSAVYGSFSKAEAGRIAHADANAADVRAWAENPHPVAIVNTLDAYCCASGTRPTSGQLAERARARTMRNTYIDERDVL